MRLSVLMLMLTGCARIAVNHDGKVIARDASRGVERVASDHLACPAEELESLRVRGKDDLFMVRGCGRDPILCTKDDPETDKEACGPMPAGMVWP